MKATIITTGLCALFFACSAEPATPSTPAPAGADSMTTAQAALVLDRVP